MFSAIIFYTVLFLALIVVPAGLVLVVLLFLDERRRLWPRITAATAPLGALLVKETDKLGLRQRFPRTTHFLTRRFDARDPWGLPATLTGLGVLIGLWFFLGVLEDLVTKDPLVTLNIRLHNAVPLFRSTGMTGFMLSLTQFGSATVLALLSAGVAILALARKQRRIAATVMLALAVTGLITASLKALFGYARPIDAIISAQDASFPSGHLLSSTVVYGLLAALLMRSRVRSGLRAIGITLLLLVIVGIGLSRLYLGVHWPSDLLGSLALALMVLASLLFFLQYECPITWVDTFTLPFDARVLRVTGSAFLLLALGSAFVLAGRMPRVPISPRVAAQMIDIQALRSALPPGLHRWSEDLIGSRMEPVSLLIVGAETELVSAMTRAGWWRADLPTPLRVAREAVAALRNQPDPTGPATPAFFADRPQDFTFEKPDSDSPSIRRRHHVRFWQTTYCLAPACRPLWVATASHDIGIKISTRLHFPTHGIDPTIDNERALLVANLVRVGASPQGSVVVSPPLHGTNAGGDAFTTDGRANVLVLP